MLWTDAASPSTRFDGQGGSLIVGPGWSPPEGNGSNGDWGSYAWVSSPQATLWFSKPFTGPLDFYARSIASPGPEGSSQSLTLVLDGNEVAKAPLDRSWGPVRLPLPPVAPGAALHRLDLRFSRVTRPDDIGLNPDQRTLAAACSTIALVPRAVLDPDDFLSSERVSPSRGEVSLPAGGALSLPLPPATSGELALTSAKPHGCSACRLEMALIEPSGKTSSLWEGPAASAAGGRASFVSPDRGISRLILRLSPPPGEPIGRGERVVLGLGKDFLRLRRRPQAGAKPGEPPDIFIYLVDTLRADSLQAYGGPAELAPRMNRFTDESAAYLGARAPSAWTLPSVTSVLTGVYPFHHHIMQGDVSLDPKANPPLSQRFADLGYDTLGLSQSYIASSAFGLSSGFETFFLDNQLNNWKLRSQEIRKMLVNWLLQRGPDRRPIFAYVQTVDVHAPYSPPPGFQSFADEHPGKLPPKQYRPSVFLTSGLASNPAEVAHLRGLYDGEILYTDAQFGRFVDLLRFLGLYDRSFVVLLSDHGEEFAEHKGFDHGRTLYDELIHVPLLIKFPGGRWAGTRIEPPVSTVDLAATLLSSLGKKDEASSLDGFDISPGTLDLGREEHRPVFSEVNPKGSEQAGPVDLRAMILGRLKCIQSLTGVDQFREPMPKWLGFDLEKDPGEHSPLPAASPLLRRCSQGMLRWLKAEQSRNPRTEGRGPVTSKESLDQLRALGYIQ